MSEIWKTAISFNRRNGIAGHLAYTNENHCAQLIEGKADTIKYLIAKIEKDPRVSVEMVFKSKLKSMNKGWDMSICYSFEVTPEQYRLISDDTRTPQVMFNSMKNTYDARSEGWQLG